MRVFCDRQVCVSKTLQNVKIIWPKLYYIVILSDPAFKTPCVFGRNKRMGKVKYVSTKYSFLQSRQHALQTAAESGNCSSWYARCWHARRHVSMYFDIYKFRKSFHCSGSAMCAVLFLETSLYGDVVTRRHSVTPFKPPIFSRTFVTASNLSSKRVVFNTMQHAFMKFTCANRNSQHVLILCPDDQPCIFYK
jgi:hypothetical protein